MSPCRGCFHAYAVTLWFLQRDGGEQNHKITCWLLNKITSKGSLEKGLLPGQLSLSLLTLSGFVCVFWVYLQEKKHALKHAQELVKM